jgi:hypothetical protein
VANPVETIRLAMDPAARAEPVAWRAVVSAVCEIADEPSADHEQLLVQLLTFQESYRLAGFGHLPHSQSPADMIRAAAIDALWKLSGTKYAAECQQVAAGAVSPIVKRLVAARFPETSTALPDTAQ